MVAILSYYCVASSILYLLFGIFCYSRNRHSLFSILWSISSVTIAVWSFGLGMMTGSGSIEAARFWLKIHYIGAILIPPTFYHYTTSLIYKDKNRKTIIVIWYVLGIFFLIANLFYRDLIVTVSRTSPFFKFYTGLGPLYVYYTIAFSICIVMSFYELITAFVDPIYRPRRNQIKYMFLASFFGFVGGSTAFFPVFNLKIFPWGMFFVVLYPALMTYAIVKHRLLDIEVIIKKTLVFAGLFAFIYGTFTTVMFLGQQLFRNALGWNEWLALIPAVFVVIFVHEPLKRILIASTDKFLFQKKYDPAELIRAFTQEVVTEYNLSQIAKMTVQKLSEILRLEACAVFIPNKDRERFFIEESQGLETKNIYYDKTSSKLLKHLVASGDIILRTNTLDKEVLEDLKMANAEIALSIASRKETVGLLTLGKKKSDEDFTKEDMDILKSFAGALGLAINTAIVFEDAIQKEKLVTVGTMVAGIRHDISNPVQRADLAIQQFELDKEQGRHAKMPPAEVLSEAYNLINRCRTTFKKVMAISTKFSDIARPKSKSEFSPVKLSMIVENCLGMFDYELGTKNIRFVKEISSADPEILCDQDYIEQILFNLIRNAVYAIEEAKKLQGLLSVRLKTQEGKVIIEIEDNGTGISQDKLTRIFDAYYTTKPEGVGTGLGLVIVKELTERMKGTISVKSVLGEGTTFILEFEGVKDPPTL